MKNILVFLCCLWLASCDEEAPPTAECDTWPSNLLTVRECCNVPQHSSSMIQDMCAVRCASRHRDQDECIIGCYVNRTRLIKDGVIDKNVAKRIYDNNVFYEHDWKRVVEQGLEKCEYVAADSMTQSLLKFYDCVSEILASNCVSFLQSAECEPTEELFEKCKKTPTNCTAWPENMMRPDDCCKTPKLVTENFRLKCKVECQRKEFYITKQLECVNNCTDAGIKTDSKFDFELVKKLLTESAKNEAWEKPIARAVESCEKVVRGLEASQQVHQMSEAAIVIHMIQCLDDHLSDQCVEFRSDSYCSKVKRFMAQCPETKPRRIANARYGLTYGRRGFQQ